MLERWCKMAKKILESERLILKPLSVNELLKINNNEMDTMETSIESEALLESVKSAISKKIPKIQKVSEDVHEWYTYWIIINKESGRGIGFIGFKGIPDESGYSEVGYSISPNYRKKRFITEALETLVKWAYEFETSKGIAANVLKINVGSIKVLSNCDFKLVGSNEEWDQYINIKE
jgi:predicted acetyltransferase